MDIFWNYTIIIISLTKRKFCDLDEPLIKEPNLEDKQLYKLVSSF